MRQAGLGFYHSEEPMAEHAAKICGAVESSFDVRDEIKAVNEEPAGVTCATSLRAPTPSVFMATSRSFTYDTVVLPGIFFSAHSPAEEMKMCIRFDSPVHCNIHISPRFIASEGLSAFLLVLSQLEALLRFTGQNLGSTNSNGKNCHWKFSPCSVVCSHSPHGPDYHSAISHPD